MKTYIVGDTVTYDSFTLDATTPIDTKTGTPDVDVASAFIVKMKTPTAANPMPTVGEHEWAYENGDKIRFFVTFSEPVTVTGSPTLKLNTGSHYEAGSADAKATFIGGGYGESKSFWKNNERSPLKSPNEPNNWYEDLYNIHDGGCTMGGFQRDLAAASDCVRLSPGGVCDCAAYSGITKATDAVVKVRRVHSFSPGDLIIIQGVTGLDAGLLNKQHAVGTVSGTGTGGNDMLTFEPPLDLTGKVFDASVAVLGRVNIGHECRSDGAGGASEHGEGYCTFSADVRHRLPTGDSTLLEHTRYAPQLPGPDGGGVVATRKEFQYNEDRVEQYMDNVLAFELTVATGGGAYDQTKGNLGATAGEAMQSNDLEYVSRHALELNGGTIKRACPMTFQIKAITCGVKTVVEVYGRHRLKPGDKIAVEGVVGDNPTTSGKYNAEHIVYAIPKVDNVVDASKFQMDFDTSDPSGLCVNTPTVTPEKSRVRRIKTVADWGDGSVCKFADAALSLPRPGDKMRGVDGYFQSLAYNKDITIGRAYVTNVSSDARDGTYGYHRDEMQARDGNSLAAENFLPPRRAGCSRLESVLLRARLRVVRRERRPVEHPGAVRRAPVPRVREHPARALHEGRRGGGGSKLGRDDGNPGFGNISDGVSSRHRTRPPERPELPVRPSARGQRHASAVQVRARAGGDLRGERFLGRVRLDVAHTTAGGQRVGGAQAAADGARRRQVRPAAERGGGGDVRERDRGPRVLARGEEEHTRARGVLDFILIINTIGVFVTLRLSSRAGGVSRE